MINSVVSTGLAVVGAFGGIVVVSGLVAKFVTDHASKQWLQSHKGQLDQELETHKAELAKETEGHKLFLKRQELMFAREIEAADAFMAMWRRVWPQHSHPDMDWHDACSAVAARLDIVERELEDFFERHSVAVSDTVRERLDDAKTQAATEKFTFSDRPEEPPSGAIDAAEKVLDSLKDARDQILKDLRR